MEIIVDRGCGIDVHKATVVACIMGTGIKKEIRMSKKRLKETRV